MGCHLNAIKVNPIQHKAAFFSIILLISDEEKTGREASRKTTCEQKDYETKL
jgi:hypothetical protein